MALGHTSEIYHVFFVFLLLLFRDQKNSKTQNLACKPVPDFCSHPLQSQSSQVPHAGRASVESVTKQYTSDYEGMFSTQYPSISHAKLVAT